jgi:DNA-binding GntR family transcriptional regulator
MSPGATFERVYLALKEQILSGAFPPGSALEPAALSAELVASITPVRDALHRLVGERLVQTPRGDGFRMPIHTEASLRDLYGWNLRLLQLAARTRRGSGAGPNRGRQAAGDGDDLASRTGRLFEAIAGLSGSFEQVAAVSSLNDRLHRLRREEQALVDGLPEVEAMEIAFESGDRPALRRQLGGYHRRRIARVSSLLERLQPSF